MPAQEANTPALVSLIAGGVAGGVEAAATVRSKDIPQFTIRNPLGISD